MALRYCEIKERILKDITLLQPHDKIMSRPAICQKYLVTRTTVDRAINELIREGILYSVDGSGTYVADGDKRNTPYKQDVINIGVLLPNIMADTYPGILKGIEDVTRKLNINVVLCNTDNNYQKQYVYVHRLLNSKIKGFIIIPAICKINDMEIYQYLLKNHVPFVFCNRGLYDVERPIVTSNDFYGGFLAADHLIQKGYARIAYLSTIRYKASIDRYQGYIAALSQHNLPIDSSLVVIRDGVPTEEQAYWEARNLFAREKRLDGIVCFNDHVALGAIRAAGEAGMRISRDIGVIGYDNTALCEMMPVRLTSVAYKNYEIGKKAAEVLYRMIRSPDQPIDGLFVFQPELQIRDSCLGGNFQRYLSDQAESPPAPTNRS